MSEPTQSEKIILVERVKDETRFVDRGADGDSAKHDAWIARHETERAQYAAEIEATEQAISQILAVRR